VELVSGGRTPPELRRTRKANAVPNFKILNSPLASPASQSPQKEKIGFPTVSGLPSPMRWFKPPASGALIRAK
jgi:hypothetical protein